MSINDISSEFIPEGFDVFCCECVRNSGYAGVMTFVRENMLPGLVFDSISKFLDSKYILFSHSILSKYDRDFITSVDEEGRVCLLFFDNLAVLNVYFPTGSEKMLVRIFENSFMN